MPVLSYVTDPRTDASAWVDTAKGEDQGLVVATRELKTYTPETRFFLNSDYGAEMNQNVAFGGTPDKVHNGTDDALWTYSAIAGTKFTEDSTTQAKNGSKSFQTNNAAVGDTAQFYKGSDVTVASYVAISMWVYVDKDWADGDSISMYGWDTGSSAVMGNAVGLEDYFDWSNYDTWQTIALPLADMGLTTGIVDALRMEIVTKQAKSPLFYLDDIQFEETGTPLIYTVEPDKGTWLWLDALRFAIAAAYDTDEANGTLPGLAYDDLLGVSITNGVVYQRWSNGSPAFTATSYNLGDWLQFPHQRIENAIHDGTNTMLSIQTKFGRDTVLKAENDDRLQLTIQDDMSGLLLYRCTITGYSEARE